MPSNRPTIVVARPPRRSSTPRPPKPTPKVGSIVKPKRRDEMAEADQMARAETADRLFRKLAGKGEEIS